MTEEQIERAVQLGARNMAREASRAMESQRADEAFEREDAPRRGSQAAREASYAQAFTTWSELDAGLGAGAVRFQEDRPGPAELRAAEAHQRRMAGACRDQTAFFRDLAEERAWANRTHDARDLRRWVLKNSPSFAGGL